MPSSITTSLLVKGCISDPLYHRACKMTIILADASILAKESPEAMLETEFQEYLTAKKGQIAGDIFEHKAKHIVLEDGGGKYFGGVEELIRLAETKMTPAFDRTEDDETDWTSIARRECEQYLTRKQCSLVYMDITLDPLTPPQRVIYQLFNQVCPKTSENFRALCTGERGKLLTGYRLSYEGTPFHRVVRGGWVQGGDIVSGDGDGGVSIYGVDFADENFSVKLNRAGILAMANDGPHTNSSQFLVTLSPQQWLNYGVVAFGRVILGLKTFLQMSELDTLNQRPITECKVNKCGELTPAEYASITCK